MTWSSQFTARTRQQGGHVRITAPRGFAGITPLRTTAATTNNNTTTTTTGTSITTTTTSRRRDVARWEGQAL
jgi:hypothetical protein